MKKIDADLHGYYLLPALWELLCVLQSLDVYGTIEGKPENHINDLTDLASATRIARDLIYGYSAALA